MTELTLLLSGDSDDCRGRSDGAYRDVTGDHPTQIGYDGAYRRHSAYRFPGVTIPPDSVVNSAMFSLTANSDGATAMYLDLYGEAADNPGAFVQYTHDAVSVLAGSKTTGVAWSLGAWVAGTRYSVDLKTIVQALIDRAGWASGNALVIAVQGRTSGSYRIVKHYAGGVNLGAKLIIEYTPPAVPSTHVMRPGMRIW